MQVVRLSSIAFCAVFISLGIVGCHNSDAKAPASGTSVSATDPNALVPSPKLTKDALRGGPMPPEAQKIFAEKMAAIGNHAAASHNSASTR